MTQTPTGQWTFLSNHAHVLLCLAAESNLRIRDIAERVGITERAVQRILSDLSDGGYIEAVREGRRNRYELTLDRPMRHPVEGHAQVADLVRLMTVPSPEDPA